MLKVAVCIEKYCSLKKNDNIYIKVAFCIGSDHLRSTAGPGCGHDRSAQQHDSRAEACSYV